MKPAKVQAVLRASTQAYQADPYHARSIAIRTTRDGDEMQSQPGRPNG